MSYNANNVIFRLEKLKGYLCLTSDGELFKIDGWKVTDEHETKGIFGKKTVPMHVSEIRFVWANQAGTTWHHVKSFRPNGDDEKGPGAIGIVEFMRWSIKSRERFVKLKEDLNKFGFTIAKAQPKPLSDKVQEAIENGAPSEETGKIIGEDLGIL